MRITPVLVAIVIVASPVVLVGSADAPDLPAAPGALVDAGPSVRAEVGGTLLLDGHHEDFGDAPTILWTGPAACAIADTTALVTTAACAESGVHAFTLTVTDSAGSASDTVLHAVREIVAQTLLTASGEVVAAAAGAVPLDETFTFVVPEGATLIDAVLHTTSPAPGLADDLDLYFEGPGGQTASGTTTLRPEVVRIEQPAAGTWNVTVSPFTADRAMWTLHVNATQAAGDVDLPDLRVPGAVRENDGTVRLYGNITDGRPLEVRWETDAGSRRFDDLVGSNVSFASARHDAGWLRGGPSRARARARGACAARDDRRRHRQLLLPLPLRFPRLPARLERGR